MKYSRNCSSCGNKETAYIHNLNVSLVQALRRLVDAYELTKKSQQLGSLHLTNSQYSNFAHLAYFGLVHNIPEGWLPTPEGIDFIHGEIPVLVPSAVISGIVLPSNHEAWKTHPSGRHEMYVKDIDTVSYKQRAEYSREKSNSLL